MPLAFQRAEYQVQRFDLAIAATRDFGLNGVRSFDLVPGEGAVGRTFFLRVDDGEEIEIVLLFAMHVQVNVQEPTGKDRRISKVTLRTVGGAAGTLSILSGGFEVATP
jgi:hypothetical protein